MCVRRAKLQVLKRMQTRICLLLLPTMRSNQQQKISNWSLHSFAYTLCNLFLGNRWHWEIPLLQSTPTDESDFKPTERSTSLPSLAVLHMPSDPTQIKCLSSQSFMYSYLHVKEKTEKIHWIYKVALMRSMLRSVGTECPRMRHGEPKTDALPLIISI